MNHHQLLHTFPNGDKLRKLVHCFEHVDELGDSTTEKVETTENQRLAEVELLASPSCRLIRCYVITLSHILGIEIT